jgi:hypothetical protein
MKTVERFFSEIKIVVIASDEIPVSFERFVNSRYHGVTFLRVSPGSEAEELLGTVPALWRYTYALDFPEDSKPGSLVRVVCNVDSWPTNVVWAHAVSSSGKSHFWGTRKPEQDRFRHWGIPLGQLFSVDCGVAVLKAGIPGACSKILACIRDDDASGWDYSHPLDAYHHTGKDSLQLARVNVMFGRDEAVLHRVLWPILGLKSQKQVVYHCIDDIGQGGRTLEIVLAGEDTYLPPLQKVLTRTGIRDLRYSAAVCYPRIIPLTDWAMCRKLTQRVGSIRASHSETVQGCRVFYFSLNGLPLGSQLTDEEHMQLQNGPWLPWVQDSLMCPAPKLLAVELHHRTNRTTDGRWHRDHTGGLYRWINVVIPLDEDYDETMGPTQIRSESGEVVLLGLSPPQYYYGFDSNLLHRASRNCSTRRKTTAFLTYCTTEEDCSGSPFFNLILNQVQERPKRKHNSGVVHSALKKKKWK